MRPWVAAAVAVAAVLILVPVVPGQSLAEVAARNRKKEQEKGKPAKVYTEDDLRGRPASSGSMSQMEGSAVNAVVASPSPAASPAPGAAKVKTEDEERAERETEWRGRLQRANEEVARLTAEIDRAQTALNDISGPLYGGTRASLITKVEEGQRQLATAKQMVVDIQEEGRRARFRE